MRRIVSEKQKLAYVDQFDLSNHVPAAILDACELCAYEQGEFLCREGEISESFFLLVSGKLQVGYLHANGHQAVFAFLLPLSVVGDIELFEQRESASNVNVRAVDRSLVLVTSAEIARRFGANDPKFLRFLLRYLARKIDFSSGLLSQVSLSAENRLARYLINRLEDEGPTFTLEKRESLAALLGVSVRHLNRTLKSLQTEKMITVKNKTVQVLSQQKLARSVDQET